MVASGKSKSIKRDSSRPVWIQGPFASPYAQAPSYDHLILVATGIGITPAVACLQHKEERQCNLIWTCQWFFSITAFTITPNPCCHPYPASDAALVRFYVHNIEFDDDGVQLGRSVGQVGGNNSLIQMVKTENNSRISNNLLGGNTPEHNSSI